MRKPRLYDLFCCAGGAAMGYHNAGFEVIGIDINPQPHYPFAFIQKDVMTMQPWSLRGADAIHASPPCQRYSNAQKIRSNDHPDLVAPVRALLIASGLPYVIENVLGAPLIDPITLCGESFGLGVYRHRLFESNVPIVGKPCRHDRPITKMGRKVRPGEMMHVVGNFSGAEDGRKAMGIPWMTRDELREAIPPAFTEYIGTQLLTALEVDSLCELFK